VFDRGVAFVWRRTLLRFRCSAYVLCQDCTRSRHSRQRLRIARDATGYGRHSPFLECKSQLTSRLPAASSPILSVCNFLKFIGTVVDILPGEKERWCSAGVLDPAFEPCATHRAGNLQTPADTTVLTQTCLELDSASARVAVAAHE
jgi:hypothetical protein